MTTIYRLAVLALVLIGVAFAVTPSNRPANATTTAKPHAATKKHNVTAVNIAKRNNATMTKRPTVALTKKPANNSAVVVNKKQTPPLVRCNAAVTTNCWKPCNRTIEKNCTVANAANQFLGLGMPGLGFDGFNPFLNNGFNYNNNNNNFNGMNGLFNNNGLWGLGGDNSNNGAFGPLPPGVGYSVVTVTYSTQKTTTPLPMDCYLANNNLLTWPCSTGTTTIWIYSPFAQKCFSQTVCKMAFYGTWHQAGTFQSEAVCKSVCGGGSSDGGSSPAGSGLPPPAGSGA